jgi:hypothetical protein
VAGQLGYCGLDRRRQPLTGDEIRGCWDARAPSLGDGTPVPLTIAAARTTGGESRPPIDFVEVGMLPSADVDDTVADASLPSATTLPAEPGWSLWGDAEI